MVGQNKNQFRSQNKEPFVFKPGLTPAFLFEHTYWHRLLTLFLLTIPVHCQSWRLNRNVMGCTEDCCTGIPEIMVYLMSDTFKQPTVHNVTFKIQRYLIRWNIFHRGAFSGTILLQCNWLKKIYIYMRHGRRLSFIVSACLPVWKTWHCLYPNNEYWVTKMAFYCMWCHPVL